MRIESPDGKEHFNGPSDVTILPDGTFYIADGYGNHRILKFSSLGVLVDIWENTQDGGVFNLPHSIDSDKEGRLYVADLVNKKVQVFDRNGGFIALWHNPDLGVPYAVMVSREKRFVVDGGSPGARAPRQADRPRAAHPPGR